MVSKRVIISKYKEDINWTKELENAGYEVLVYNKDTRLNHYKDVVKKTEYWIDLCNIGREAHTYLTHIVNNYDDLRDIEVFFQGHIRDHVSYNRPSDLLKDCEKELFRAYMDYNKIGCFNETIYKEMKQLHPRHKHINVLYPPEGDYDYRMFKELFPDLPYPTKPYDFKPAALFSVQKKVILGHPKEFYETCLNYFNPEAENFLGIPKQDFQATMPYRFEVFWQLIFTILFQNSEELNPLHKLY